MKTKLTLLSTIATAAMLAGGPAMAQTDLLDGWSGSASLGALFTSGNSDTTNVNGSASVSKQINEWRHTAFGSTYTAENNDVKSADRLELGYKVDRQFSDTMYGFGRLRYDTDEFGNIDSRFSGIVGVGRRILDDGKQSLSGELGIGAQKTEFLLPNGQVMTDPADPDAVDENGLPVITQTAATGLEDDSAVLYGGLNYSNILNEMVTFNSVFSFEAGENNTLTVWDNSLNVSLSDRISLSFGLLTRNNTDIEGSEGENTDTATRFGVVFGI